VSNYVLQLELGDGFNKAESALDSLLKKVGELSNSVMDLKIDLSGILDSSSAKKEGEKAGKAFEEGVKKVLGGGLAGMIAPQIQQPMPIRKKTELDWWKKGGADMQGPDLSGELRRKNAPQPIDWKKILTGLALGFTNPYIGSRVLSDEMGKKLSAKEGGIAGGLFGKGGIAGFSEIFIAFKVGKFAFDQLIKAVKETVKAYENARQIYAKSLIGGMGLNFTVKRGTLASIMGVSEQDVFRFGAQMAYLNPKIEWATKILADTAKPLTQVSWEFKILEQNLAALFAKIANAAAPAILSFIDAVNEMIKSFGDTSTIEYWVNIMTKTAAALTLTVGAIVAACQGLVVGVQLLADSLTWLLEQITNIFTRIKNWHGAEKARNDAQQAMVDEGVKTGRQHSRQEIKDAGDKAYKDYQDAPLIDTKDAFRPTMIAIDSLNKTSEGFQKMAESLWNGGDKKKRQEMPNPQSWMKQLPASSWEKMGLVTMGSNQNYAKDTAKNTRDTAKAVTAMAKHFMSRGGKDLGTFGMSALTNNP
jgi:hypothetical protein